MTGTDNYEGDEEFERYDPFPGLGAGNGKADNFITATPYQWIAPHTLPLREWLYGRHLIRKFLSATVAAGGVGKSTLLVAENLELVSGQALITRHHAEPLGVWYWNGEDPYEEIQRRVQAACLHYNLSESDLGGRLFVDTGRRTPITIATDDRGELKIATPVIDAIKDTIERNKIDVFRIDPFISSHRVPENDNGKIEAVATAWAEIADATNCSIDLVHHIRKTSGEVSADDARGAGSLVNRCRSIRLLNRMTDKEAEAAEVENRLLYFRLTDGKVNLAPASEAAAWCRLESVSLGNGEPPDMVGVAVRWKWSLFGDVTVEDLREVQQRLATGNYRSSPKAENWAGKMVADVLGWDIQLATVKKTIAGIIAQWGKTGAVKVVQRKDEKRNNRNFLDKGNPV